MTGWQEFPWQSGEPDPALDRLVAGRPRAADLGGPEHLVSEIEGADFRPHDFRLQGAIPVDELVVCAYNVERGLRLEGQLRAFAGNAGVPAPDILLLSEADRGCTRSGDRNVAREYAQALGMCYVYGVEFIELPRIWGPGGPIRRPCEHGNAILSRFPLGNVRLIRHRSARSWNSAPQRRLRVGQPRMGGRVAVAADVLVGGRLLRVYAVHLESGRISIGRRSRHLYRRDQVGEIVEDASGLQQGVVIGGDMNVVRYLGTDGRPSTGEPAIDELFAAGFDDAHVARPPHERATNPKGAVIDLIVGRGVRFTGAGVGPADLWDELSDHRPVWARIAL